VTVYVSSLVDWYLILPRITGLLGPRPCRREDRAHPGFPRTWRETTRWWHIHRIAGALTFRYGLGFALSLTLHRHVALFGGATIVTGALLGFVNPYLRGVGWAALEAAHPSAVVGWTVRRRATTRVPRRLFRLGRRAITLPGLKRGTVGPPGEREYVFDVALETFEVVTAEPRERSVPETQDGVIEYERRPRKVKLKEAAGCEAAEQRFTGCDGRCSGINWYCIENVHCFEPK
jgi:hypothetical protein